LNISRLGILPKKLIKSTLDSGGGALYQLKIILMFSLLSKKNKKVAKHLKGLMVLKP